MTGIPVRGVYLSGGVELIDLLGTGGEFRSRVTEVSAEYRYRGRTKHILFEYDTHTAALTKFSQYCCSKALILPIARGLNNKIK